MSKTALLIGLSLGVVSAFGTNIILNPSFETWLGSVPLGWLSSEPLYPGSATRDSNALSGRWCVRLNSADTTAFVSTATVVRAGFSYRFSGFARVPGVLGGSFVLQFLSLAGGAVGSPVMLPAYYSGSSYRQYSRWVTAPDSAALLSVSFVSVLGAVAYVDSVTLDDTTLTAVEEPAVCSPGRRRVASKLVVVGKAQRTVGAGERVYDPLGRSRTAGGALPRGIWFVPARRQDAGAGQSGAN